MATGGGIRAGKAFVILEAVDKTAMVLGRVGKRFKAFGNEIVSIGKNIAQKAFAFLTPAALGTKVFVGFDDAMRKVEARSKGTAGEMAALREQAKALGRATSFTASQVGELQAKLAQKGFNRSAIRSMTGDVMNLAKAAGEGSEEDTVLSADLISGTLRAFQMEADQATRVADVFTVAVNNSNFSLQDLNDSMPKAAALAKQYGMSLEETVATLASMTNLSVAASESGNALKTFFARMSDQGAVETFNNKLKQLTGQTVTFTNASGDLRKPLEILGEIDKATAGLGSAQKGDLLSKLFGTFQFSKAASAAAGKQSADELLGQLNNASGAAQKTSEKMEAGIGGTFRKLWSAVEGVGIALGEAVEGPLRGFTDWLTNMLGPMTEWLAANNETVAIVAGVAAALLAGGIAVMGFGYAATLAGAAFTALAIAVKVVIGLMTFLLSPIGLVVAAVAGLLIAFELLTGGISNAFSGVVGYITGQLQAMLASIKWVMGAIMDAIKLGRFDLAWAITWAAIKVIWLSGIGWVLNTVDSWIATLLNVFTRLQFGLAKIMTDLWDGIRVIFFSGIQGLKVLMLTIIEFLTSKISDYIGSLLKKVGKAAQKVPGAKTAGKALVSAGESLSNLAEGVSEQRQNAENELNKGVAKIGQENIDKKKELDAERDRILQGRADKNAGKAATRQKAVDDAKAELKDAIDQVDKATAEAEKIAEEAPTIPEPQAPKQFQQDAPQTSPAQVSPGLIKGLEKGSIEALEQANKNAQNKVWNKMLDKQDEQIAATNAVKDAVDSKDGVAGV